MKNHRPASQSEAMYCRINFRGELQEFDKSLGKLLGIKITPNKILKLADYFRGKQNISYSKLSLIIKTEKIFSHRGTLRIANSETINCEAIYLRKDENTCLDVIFRIVENTEKLMKEIEALNSIADHNFEKLIKANEKLEIARRAEKEAILSKEKFLTNVSHELRTPLNGISGIIQLLSKTNINATQADYLNSISHSAKNMVSMINELLDFSKLKSGKFDLKIADFSLEECINYTASAFSIISSDTKINFNLNYDKNIPAVLKGDSLRISQIINNLLNNAFKFTESGFVYLEARLLRSDHKNAWVELKVTDSGVGIPKEKLGKIFEEFYQAEIPTRIHSEGTGLGLTISKHLVQIHSGTIDVSSKPGTGTTFTVIIPFEIGKSKKKNTTKKQHQLLTGKTILVCDDNPVNLLIMEKVLIDQGADVIMAKNGTEVLPLLTSIKFDAFLIDLNMPVMDGFELAQEIRKNYSAPMLAVTAGNSEVIHKKCELAGFVEIVFKPFSNEELVHKTLNCINRSSVPLKKHSNIAKKLTIDFNKIESIANGNKKTFNELITTIINNLEKDIPLFKKAIANSDFKSIRFYSHKLRTVYGYLSLRKELNRLISIEKLSEEEKKIEKIKSLFDPLFEQKTGLLNELNSCLV